VFGWLRRLPIAQVVEDQLPLAAGGGFAIIFLHRHHAREKPQLARDVLDICRVKVTGKEAASGLEIPQSQDPQDSVGLRGAGSPA
jgi:hypothetical protein